MKVVYILAVSWGGIPHYTAELANAVSKYADVVVLKPKDHNDSLFSKDIEVMQVFKPLQFSRGNIKRAYSLGNLRNMFSYVNVKIINKINTDVIHFPELYPYLNPFVCLYRLSNKCPIIYTSHAPLPLKTLKTYIRLWTLPETLVYSVSVVTKMLVKVNKIIVHTQEAKNILIRSGVNPEKIEVIPHGVYTLFKKYKQNNEKEAEENCILLFGQIGRNKGVDILLKAVPIVLNEINDAKFIIAGEGNILEHLKNENSIRKYRCIEIYNRFIPNDFVSYLFCRAKVVVLPYKGVGRGINQSGVLTIALSFGKPVIATYVATTPEIIRGCGIVIPPNNPKALAEAIITILKDERLRKKMSRNALKMAEKLSWDNIAKMHIKVYEEVLNERRSRS